MEKQFKIEYGYPPKTDKWGHYLANQPTTHVEQFDDLSKAIERATAIAKAHRKFYVNVYDLDSSFEDEEHVVMLVVGFDKGIPYYNDNYSLPLSALGIEPY